MREVGVAARELPRNRPYNSFVLLDDGTGQIYPDNPTGNPDPNAVRDDDRERAVVIDRRLGPVQRHPAIRVVVGLHVPVPERDVRATAA